MILKLKKKNVYDTLLKFITLSGIIINIDEKRNRSNQGPRTCKNEKKKDIF